MYTKKSYSVVNLLQEMSVTPRPRLRERSASEESRSELCSTTFPGDTLPWNLPKHQRVKRSKSASGDVLDPAERAVIRIAGKRWSESEYCFCCSTVKHTAWLYAIPVISLEHTQMTFYKK